jgi:hypothetical protein
MFNNTWNVILEWFQDWSARNFLIRTFNASAREAFVSGSAPTLLKASVSKGERTYRHQFSNWFFSGFRLQAFTGRVLSKDEIITIGKVILEDEVLTRKLIVLGWDTLEIFGDKGEYGCRWQLKDYLSLPQYTQL